MVGLDDLAIVKIVSKNFGYCSSHFIFLMFLFGLVIFIFEVSNHFVKIVF